MKKKSLLITLASLAIGGVQAQYLHQSAVSLSGNAANTKSAVKDNFIVENKSAAKAFTNLQKTTGVVIATETFGSGTNTTLPTGWTATGVAPFTGASWKWRNQAVPGAYSIGALNSTTAANGWMVYDSDSIGSLFPTSTNIEGYLTSPTYVCTGHSTVQVTFQQYFRKFQDSCFVDVSNNGGTTWTTFPITSNNNLSGNSYVPTNATTTNVNITSVAANQANVKIRFHYKGTYAGGSYNWLIDDVVLNELDPVEVDVHKSFVFGGWGDYGSTLVVTPLQFTDSVGLVTLSNNNGYNAQTAAPYSVAVYKNGVSVNTQTLTKAMPLGATDSIVQFANAYKPDATGTYNVVYKVNATGDANATNNVDTATFTVTDTLFTNASGTISGGYYIHRGTTAGTEISYYQGARFDIPVGASDTLTGISAAFSPSTTAGVKVIAQLYKFDGAAWTAFATSKSKTLTASEISTSAAIKYSYFALDLASSGGIESFVLTEGTYAIVIQGDNVPASSSVVIYATNGPNATQYSGYFGQSDTSSNTGGAAFSFGSTPATGLTIVPVVRAHFANNAKHQLSVAEVANTFSTAVYPNPASNTVSIPVTVTESADVSVKILNTIGQVVATQSLGTVSANSTKEAKFNTSSLPTGIYLYVVDVNGERVSERFTVAH